MMKGSRTSKMILLLLVFLSLRNCLYSQDNFGYKAALNTVPQNGFYNIALTPAMIAKCKPELEDVRIQDSNGKEVPYILYTESARPDEEAFTEFPLSYSENQSAIISNILPNSISKLFLLIKNSEAQRIAALSGSDDATHWLIIKENIVLQNEYTAGSDAFVQSVSFPQSSYKYFRITMPGKSVLPLNIIKAGVYRQSFSGSVYDSLPSPAFLQKDSSDKRSYFYLLFDDAYAIDKLIPRFSDEKYDKRSVALYDKNISNTVITEDTLSSARGAGIEFHEKTNRILLVIDNKNSAPLTLTGVAAFGLHTSVTAYLEKGKNYALYMGDSSVLAPAYDLQYFSDSIGSNIHSLAAKKLETLKAPAMAEEENKGSKWLVWSSIIAVLLLFVYFSFRLIKDNKNKKDGDVNL